MPHPFLIVYVLFALIVGLIIGLCLLIFDEGIPLFKLTEKLCKLGIHKRKMLSVRKYYCVRCKIPRKDIKLVVVEGGNKLSDNNFKD